MRIVNTSSCTSRVHVTRIIAFHHRIHILLGISSENYNYTSSGKYLSACSAKVKASEDSQVHSEVSQVQERAVHLVLSALGRFISLCRVGLGSFGLC